ncbi:MAG: DNA mismatch repair endonuclease MutL [Oscillospiraceae bacterium]|nr:DNA mismatch repair endonuclease MutL [Oscillospiraceae bacterium]
MGRINVLDKHTAELIAAGEVVERPSSVVKELLENSIDAGADKITVEIQHGGISFLRISDNGHGIMKDDIRNAFKRNATSKISSEIDLEKIGTLGFRGEALASISSVSKVQLITKAIEEEIGTAYEIEGGVEKSFNDAGCPDGTTFIMRDLFYNVPARYKFLKKDIAEGNAVAGVIDRIALSHPDIAITFIRDNKTILKTSGDGKLLSAIYSVYGRDFANSLITVDYELNGMHLTGYVSKPAGGRANRNMQNTFINGRFVRSKTISIALEEACKGAVMVGKFPSCVLNLKIAPEAVDVNVHPSKIEVRFINERPVFDTVYHGIKSALLKGDTRKEAVIGSKVTNDLKKINPFALANKVIKEDKNPVKETNSAKKSVFDELELNTGISSTKNSKIVSDFSSPKKAYLDLINQQTKVESRNDFIQKSVNTISDNTKVLEIEESKLKPIAELEYNSSNTSIPKPIEQDITTVEEQHNISEEKHTISTLIDKDEESFRFIGEAMDTYIIVETDNNKIVLIDKHAAHERIIFEKLKKEKGKGTVQMLLLPVTVTLEKSEYNAAINHLDMFKEVGFDVENFGNGTVIVRSAPSYLKDADVEDSIVEICGHIAENRKGIATEHMEWIYHNISCRAAIKAGNKSTTKELIDIANTVFNDDNIRYCPHGRPVCIELSKYEIEKQFGRV